MKLSVIIPVKDRVDDLMLCLSSLFLSFSLVKKENVFGLYFEIIVVDDHSVENIPYELSKKNLIVENLHLIKNDGFGPAAARNTGISHANGDFWAFVDSDCIVDEQWLDTIIETVQKNDFFAYQGVPWLHKLENNPSLGNLEQKLYQHFFSPYINGKLSLQVDTRNFILNKKILSLLPEPIFSIKMKKAQAESRALGLKLRDKGVNILWCKEIKVYHKDPDEMRSVLLHKRNHGAGRAYIWDQPRSLERIINWYFIEPIKAGIPPSYVIPAHLAFIEGYFSEKGLTPNNNNFIESLLSLREVLLDYEEKLRNS